MFVHCRQQQERQQAKSDLLIGDFEAGTLMLYSLFRTYSCLCHFCDFKASKMYELSNAMPGRAVEEEDDFRDPWLEPDKPKGKGKGKNKDKAEAASFS